MPTAIPQSLSLKAALQQAVSHHQAGRLQEAERLYRAILEAQPSQPDANHNLGVLAGQVGQHAAGLPYLKTALAINPSQGQYALSYAEALLLATGQAGEALSVLQDAMQRGINTPAVQALRKKMESATLNATAQGTIPTPTEINQLVALFNARRYAELESQARLLLDRCPVAGFVWKALGSSLEMQGKEALPALQKATEYLPDDAEAHCNLGNALRDLGQFDGAIASYHRALEIKPEYAGVHTNLGNALKELGQLDDAVASYRRALEIKPEYAELHSNLGNILQALGQLDNAVASYRRALEIKPDFAEAHNNLGNALKALGQLDNAVASHRRALEIKPDFAEAHSNLGNALLALGQLDDAVANHRRALEIKPEYALGHNNLGAALQTLGQLDHAIASYRRALEIKPEYAEAHSNLLFCLTHSEAMDAQALFAEHHRFAEQFEAPLRANWPQHSNSRDPDRPLRVGFVSGDLRNHVVANFIEPVLARLAVHPQLSLYAYYNHAVEDAVSQRLQQHLTHWHAIARLSDAALARKIREDGIDILIDLSGHTSLNRLLGFARKPAPVQVSWIGYPGTTGLNAMDYYLADRFFLPPGQFDDQFTEKLVHMPAVATFLPFDDAPPVNALPALSNGYVTFGSFNRLSKLNPSVIALWSQLLRALPNARMVLGAMPQAGENEMLIDWFAREGIARERLSFYSNCPMKEYLTLHHQVDICLDTFPYPGGTTSCHALWMGVPTLSLTGNTPASRVGATWLNQVGLEAFVAHDKTEFVEKGLYWAGHLAELADIRDGLRVRFGQSALGQPDVVSAALESALRTMWQRWCAGLPAESFAVLPQASDMPTQGKEAGS